MLPAAVILSCQALAKNFGPDYAAFARLLGDESEETRELMRELNIVEVGCPSALACIYKTQSQLLTYCPFTGQVPTFLFYRNGQPVGRHVGSSRGDLIGQILQQQQQLGIAPPPPAGGSLRRQVSRRRTARASSR